MNIGPFIVLPLHLKYFMMIFYLSYLPYIRLSFSLVVTSSSEVSLLVHECPSPAFFFIFPLMTSAYSDSYFNVTGLLGYSTVTMQESTYFLCMIVLFCPTRHLLHEWDSSLFLLKEPSSFMTYISSLAANRDWDWVSPYSLSTCSSYEWLTLLTLYGFFHCTAYLAHTSACLFV